ncbi:MAG TPA: EamA family transporter [Methylomusa anaerophila]|uniref:Putative amino-acid metabolite efflux pump n=1 Tax=Methylomusa anaerophila TaxID=1930071 RepID=A0A348AMT1_9FIRM|nr:EamA family transporter [Methylomusa anaerophila]BBB92379.1 putative amino-acid metabolite efflux pump [Methylomusa anaerophila]HML89983.1 EamA family transporter [Methylomusa anaerophila]
MYLVYGLMCVIFGTTFLAIKVGVEAGAPPFLFAALRFFISGAIILAAFRATNAKVALTRAQGGDVIFIGMTMTAILFGCLYWGEQFISSSAAALLSATSPLLIALLEYIKGSREAAAVKACGLILAFFGVSIALAPSLNGESSEMALLAIFIILLSEVTCALGTMRSRKVMESGLNPFVLNGWQMIVGGLALTGLSAATEDWRFSYSNDVYVSWLYLIVFGSLIGHGSYYWLVRKAGPLLPSTWTYVSPVIAQFAGYYWLTEQLSVWSFAGLALVLLGVFFIGRSSSIKEWFRGKQGIVLKS